VTIASYSCSINLKMVEKNPKSPQVGLPFKAGDWINKPLKEDTVFVHAGVSPDPKTGAILTPVAMSTTFVQESVEQYLEKGYSYSRSGNPTVTAFEQRVAAVENAVGAAAFGTGMAATSCVISAFMKTGDHCVMADCSYGGTNRIARVMFRDDMGMQFTFVDMTNAENVRKAIIPGKTKLIFSETPANPLLKLVDIEAISKIAKEHKIVHVCDSTFATPVICRPIDHGADITLQSTTKFYDGFNTSTGGALACASKEHLDRILFVRNMQGSIMSPMVAFLQLQFSKTMPLRVRRQSENAMRIARFLEKHQKVGKVVYPGLESFPQKALADKLHRNNVHGSMLWFDLKEGGSAAGTKLMDTIQRPWSLCENLGATESIITACAVMTHANMLKEDREKLGITDGFIRVSCGIEDAEDLISSLDASLNIL
jgi:cystathionine gamma-lyase